MEKELIYTPVICDNSDNIRLVHHRNIDDQLWGTAYLVDCSLAGAFKLGEPMPKFIPRDDFKAEETSLYKEYRYKIPFEIIFCREGDRSMNVKPFKIMILTNSEDYLKRYNRNSVPLETYEADIFVDATTYETFARTFGEVPFETGKVRYPIELHYHH